VVDVQQVESGGGGTAAAASVSVSLECGCPCPSPRRRRFGRPQKQSLLAMPREDDRVADPFGVEAFGDQLPALHRA
jgi:hypothetical protein